MQYKHYQLDRRTFAIRPCKLDILEEAIAYFIAGERYPVPFAIGMARVHPRDNFCKKTGREVALSRIKMRKLYIHSVSISKKKILLTLKNKRFMLDVLWTKGNDRPHVAVILDRK